MNKQERDNQKAINQTADSITSPKSKLDWFEHFSQRYNDGMYAMTHLTRSHNNTSPIPTTMVDVGRNFLWGNAINNLPNWRTVWMIDRFRIDRITLKLIRAPRYKTEDVFIWLTAVFQWIADKRFSNPELKSRVIAEAAVINAEKLPANERKLNKLLENTEALSKIYIGNLFHSFKAGFSTQVDRPIDTDLVNDFLSALGTSISDAPIDAISAIDDFNALIFPCLENTDELEWFKRLMTRSFGEILHKHFQGEWVTAEDNTESLMIKGEPIPLGRIINHVIDDYTCTAMYDTYAALMEDGVSPYDMCSNMSKMSLGITGNQSTYTETTF